jgi:CRP/FNR family transcriptional regulator, anaerobic regulatory protein
MLANAIVPESPFVRDGHSLGHAFGTRSQPMVNLPSRSNQPTATIRCLGSKEHVFRDGDPALFVYQIEAGHVCLYRVLSDGRRQVVDFAFPGDFVGLGAMNHYTVSAQTSDAVRLKCYPVASLQALVRSDPDLSLELYKAVSQSLQAARELLITVCQRTAIERVATFLLNLLQRNARRGQPSRDIVLSMTRTDIANFLGLTIETVSRTLTKLRHEGIISIEQCVLVTINDVAKLKAAAGATDPGSVGSLSSACVEPSAFRK